MKKQPRVKRQPDVKKQPRKLFSRLCQGELQDYVTALTWSPQGDRLAIASAAGEVILVEPSGERRVVWEGQANSQTCSINVLQFSAQGRWLAAARQAGEVYCWDLHQWDLQQPLPTEPLSLTHGDSWIDQLVWHPTQPLFAFGLGRYVQVWDAAAWQVVATLPCELSSALGLAWHPLGNWLAVTNQQEIRLWNGADWDAEPTVLEMASAGVALAVSHRGEFIASGNLDRTLLMWRDGVIDSPWRMQGFSGKVRQLAWSKPLVGSAPLLASASGKDVVLWKKTSQDDAEGWKPRLLELHQGRVEAIAFQPNTLLLASADAEGCIGLWRKDCLLAQRGLRLNPRGFQLWLGILRGAFWPLTGKRENWTIWKAASSGQGFG